MADLTARLLDPETAKEEIRELLSTSAYLTGDDFQSWMEENLPPLMAAAIRELHRLLATAQCDDLECDGTDAAHPAWWRGNDRGCDAAVEVLEKVLATGKCGNYGSPKLTAAMHKVVDLMDALATAKADIAAAREDVAQLEKWLNEDPEMRLAEVLVGESYRWCVRLEQVVFDDRCSVQYEAEAGTYSEALRAAIDSARAGGASND